MESVSAHSEREWILVGMAERCAAQGFEATTVDDVCAAAGVSRESFKRLFADADSCLAATVESAIEQARQAVAEETSPRRTWAANLRDGTVALLRFFAGRPTFAHVLLVEAAHAGGRAADLVDSANGDLLAFLARGHEHAANQIPASAARGALAGAKTLIVRQIVANETGRLADVAPDTVYMLAVPFLGISETQQLASGATTRRRHLRAVA